VYKVDYPDIDESKKIRRKMLLNAVELIKRDLHYLRALHAFISDRRDPRLSRMDVWENLTQYLFKTKSLTGVNKFYLPIEIPQVPVPDINVDTHLFNLAIERLVSNAFIAAQKNGFWRQQDAIRQIRIQVVPTEDFNDTQIVISNPSKISAAELREQLRLNPDRPELDHGISVDVIFPEL